MLIFIILLGKPDWNSTFKEQIKPEQTKVWMNDGKICVKITKSNPNIQWTDGTVSNSLQN